MNRPIRVCFVADIYPLLHPEAGIPHGGAEVQQIHIARALAADPDFEIAFVVLDHGQPSEERLEGLRLLSSYPPRGGIPKLRLVHPRLHRLWRALDRAGADVYYQRGAGMTTGLVALYSALRARPFVFAVANDRDLDGSFEASHPLAHRCMYRLGLARADLLIAQTRTQKRLLLERHGRDSVQIPSVRPAAGTTRAGPSGPVLWIGSLDPIKKRPQLALDIAQSLPHRSFLLAGSPPPGIDATAIVRRASLLSNVRYLGSIPWNEVDRLYGQASLLLATSAHEGFSNVFLEAWSHGLPVVSMGHDPDGVIARHGLGFHVDSSQDASRKIEETLGDSRAYAAISARAIDHVATHHAPRLAGDAYRTIFLQLASGGRSRRHLARTGFRG